RWYDVNGRTQQHHAALASFYPPDLDDPTAEHVQYEPEGALAHRHRDRLPGRLHLHAAAQAVGGAERDAAHHAVAELLLDLEGQTLFHQRVFRALLEQERLVDARHVLAREFDVDHRADGLNDRPSCHVRSSGQTAAAPPTISESSLVMPAWRFLL